MQLSFYKYQGTGNDFIIIDNRQLVFDKNNTKLVASLCDRKFGIGADGLILLEDDSVTDFKMVYYNSDGNQSSMCGNGGRCIVAFANYLGIIEKTASFMAIDGLHHAVYDGDEVKLQMTDVNTVSHFKEYSFLNTGSPHHVQMCENLKEKDIKKLGAAIRYGKYGTSGSNINFVEHLHNNEFKVRTYERGVEDETLSCGTGVTAVAIAVYDTNLTLSNHVILHTPGGKLEVSFEKSGEEFTQIFLKGPATLVFKGEITC